MTSTPNHITNEVVPESNTAETEQLPDAYSKRSRWVRTIEGFWAGVTILPTNEAIRVALFGATLKFTKDPYVTSLMYGASTIALEGSGAAATANILDSASSHRAINWANDKLSKLGITPETKTSKPVKAATAVIAGTSALLLVKQREEPRRTLNENLRYSGETSIALGTMCTAQSFAAAEGILTPNPETIGVGLLAVSSLFAVGKWVKNKVRTDK